MSVSGEPPFTVEELEYAAALRQSVSPAPDVRRRDRCPHTPACSSIEVCIEAIAWYLRHRAELDTHKRDRVSA